MAKIKIEHWQLIPGINPDKILNTYLQKLRKAAPSNQYDRSGDYVIEKKADGSTRILLQYDQTDKSWHIFGNMKKLLPNAFAIGLKSPYLRLLQHNLNRFSAKL